MKNKRLDAMIARVPEYIHKGGQFPVWVDCFMGRCFYQEVAPALRTRSINDNNDFIMEEKIRIPQATKEGYIECEVGGVFDASYPGSKTRRGRVQEGGSIAPTTTCNCDGLRRVEPKAVSSTGESTGHGGNTDCLIAEPMCSVHPNSHKFEFDPETSIKPISPALRATDYKAPHCVYEPNVMTPKRTEFGKAVRKQYESGELNMSRHDMTMMEPRTDGISNTLTSVQKDNMVAEPFNADGDCSQTIKAQYAKNGEANFESQGSYGATGTLCNYRIRKLTPRECFRLMGVSEKDIDTIQGAGISNSQQYKMAGNSIVVDVLEDIFRELFRFNPLN